MKRHHLIATAVLAAAIWTGGYACEGEAATACKADASACCKKQDSAKCAKAEKAEAKAEKADPKGAPAAAAARAFIDADGNLVAPTEEQLKQIAAEAAAHPQAATAPRIRPVDPKDPSKGQLMDMSDFRFYSVAVKAPDGTVKADCVPAADAKDAVKQVKEGEKKAAEDSAKAGDKK